MKDRQYSTDIVLAEMEANDEAAVLYDRLGMRPDRTDARFFLSRFARAYPARFPGVLLFLTGSVHAIWWFLSAGERLTVRTRSSIAKGPSNDAIQAACDAIRADPQYAHWSVEFVGADDGYVVVLLPEGFEELLDKFGGVVGLDCTRMQTKDRALLFSLAVRAGTGIVPAGFIITGDNSFTLRTGLELVRTKASFRWNPQYFATREAHGSV